MERSQSIDCPGLRDLFHNLRAASGDDVAKIEAQIIEIADSWTALHVLETQKKTLEENLVKFNMLADKISEKIKVSLGGEEDDDADMDDEPPISTDLYNMMDAFAKHAPAKEYEDFANGRIDFGDLLKALPKEMRTESHFQEVLMDFAFQVQGKVRRGNWERMKIRNITSLVDYLKSYVERIDDGESADVEDADDADEWGQIHDALEAFAIGRASNAACDSFVAGGTTFGQLLQTFGVHKNASVAHFREFMTSKKLVMEIRPSHWGRMKDRTIDSLSTYLVDLLVEPVK